MGKKQNPWLFLSWIDVVLLGVAVALFTTGALLLRLSPAWWGYYLMALDVRIWPPWKCIGLVGVLMESLLMIRYWPNKRHRQTPAAKGRD